MDISQTILLEMGMKTLQRSIPEDERCPSCKGRGQLRVGCALSHAIYNTCYVCFGGGRAKAYLIGERYNAKEKVKRIELCPSCKQHANSLNINRNKKLNSNDYHCKKGHGWRLNRNTMVIEEIPA